MADPVVLVGKRPQVAGVPTAGMGLALDMGGKFSSGLMSGSVPYSQLTLANSIVNADINTAAAIAASKLAGYPTDASKGLDGAGNWTGSQFKLYHQVAGSSVASFDINPVVGTFAHLLIMGKLRGDTAAAQTSAAIRFNNDSGANYLWGELRGIVTTASMANASATTSAYLSAVGAAAASSAAGVFSPVVAFLPNYAAAQAQDLIALSAYASSPGVHVATGHWSTANAITRITILPGAGNWAAGSCITVYGIGA